MNNVFDFTPSENSERIIKSTWNEFRLSVMSVDTLDQAKQLKFLKVFDDAFEKNNSKEYFTINLGDLSDLYLYRGTILKDERDVKYERFLPDSKYISNHNRFSPPGVEWLYLGMSRSKKNAQRCCIKECRAKKGDYFGLCKFEINPVYKKESLVDLTIGMSRDYDQINNELENAARRHIEETSKMFIQTLDSKYLKGTADVSEKIIKKWFTQVYTKLLAEQIFLPINGGNKAKEYCPFQWMAKYFESLGYKGIIYKSTVCDGAKNVVLFDKYMALPVKKHEFVINH